MVDHKAIVLKSLRKTDLTNVELVIKITELTNSLPITHTLLSVACHLSQQGIVVFSNSYLFGSVSVIGLVIKLSVKSVMQALQETGFSCHPWLPSQRNFWEQVE